MTMKRSRKEEEDYELEADQLTDCLMLLSKIGERKTGVGARLFECKSCKKQFNSFQALGGHRASHKKLKLMASDFLNQSQLNSCMPKKHECSICGLQFNMGQALGGHMRRHRVDTIETKVVMGGGGEGESTRPTMAVLKRSNSKRVFGLDLNLMPYENDLILEMKSSVPVIKFFV